MSSYRVFNIRMQQVAVIHDVYSTADALAQAKEKWPGASVEKILTTAEQRYKERQEEHQFWESMHPNGY